MINEIIGNHEITLENVKHVFYSNCTNNTLFISFAGKIDKYVSVTWFYNQTNFLGNFLFLKNDYDYNTYQDENYEKLINHYITRLKITNLITYGPSMGGIASIIYGLKFNANIIISIDPNPVNYDYHLLLEQIRNHNNNYDFKNKIYLNYTFFNDFDTLPPWTDAIVSEVKKKNIVTILQPFRSIDHLFFIPSKEYLLNIIKAQMLLEVKNYSDPNKWL
jgi:hypothetical protein